MDKQKPIVMTTGSGYRIILVDENGNYLGKADDSRFINAKWHQKLLGNISRRYKRKFIDVKGFNIKLKL